MQNHSVATERRLSDPDFQGWVVRNCLLAITVLSLLLVAFVGHDAWVWTHSPQPRYFLVDGASTPRAITPLDSPIVDDTELLNWTVKWTLAPYNVNYHDFPEQLNTAGRHYTQAGWNSFADSYIKGGNFEEMKHARLLCFAQAQRAALIRQSALFGGRLAYQVQFPMVQTCQNSQQEMSQNLMMTATVIRVDDMAHPDGLAINQLVAKAY